MSDAPLPRLDGPLFLTDGGLETTLVFHESMDLPCFAAFPLLRDADGRQRLERYFEPYLRTAAEHRVGFVLDTPTWRANADWGAKLGYSAEDLAAVNREAVAFAHSLRQAHPGGPAGVAIDGAIGPRGDGYRIDDRMTAEEAERYHRPQIDAFAEAGADMVTAFTMTYVDEAVGIVRAAAAAGLPVVISFTVETDGRLASGDSLEAAIQTVDDATGGAALYFMINCAHPSHFDGTLREDSPVVRRIGGLRANASAKSHAELDDSTELDAGDPEDLAGRYRQLRRRLPRLSVLGGCCGTDHRHVRAIATACLH